MSSAGKTVIVTGASSGIGLEAAKALQTAGCRVYGISRRKSPAPGVETILADVADGQAVFEAVRAVHRLEGRIDALICCAGFGISGAVEFTKEADARRQMDVNFFGTDNVVRAALPFLRSGGGNIVLVSSVAGVIPIPFQTYYSASKAAINAYASALRNEVRAFGVQVCAVMPGDTRTGFTDVREKNRDGDDVYGGRIGRSVAGMERDERKGAPAGKAGRFLCRLALKKRLKPLYTIGVRYKLFVFLLRILPRSLVSGVVGMMYAI